VVLERVIIHELKLVANDRLSKIVFRQFRPPSIATGFSSWLKQIADVTITNARPVYPGYGL
jgi:hypothetical protein